MRDSSKQIYRLWPKNCVYFAKRRPTSPGEILQKEFLEPLNMTQKELAKYVGCDIKVINRIINERTRITAKMALRLACIFKNTPEFWMTAQSAIDLYDALKNME